MSDANLARLGFVGDCSKLSSTAKLMEMYFEAYLSSTERGITGVFICDGKRVGQVLEGDEGLIDKVLESFKNDGRYQNLSVFEKQKTKIRLYESWQLHIKDGIIMTLLYPQCRSVVNEINADSTEEILGIMHSYSSLVQSH